MILVLSDCHYPNLISRFSRFMLQRLSRDWEHRWGHPIALVETVVDPKRYQGTAYKVSGWCHLGRTAGWKRDADEFHLEHDSPKQIGVRVPPRPRARTRALTREHNRKRREIRFRERLRALALARDPQVLDLSE
jgi:hypothetical protein